MIKKRARDMFEHLAHKSSRLVGSGAMFFLAMVAIVVWLWLGPIFHFSNTWQLLINTFTTISTFLMVFLLQNSQNHDTAALHVKLNELLRIHNDARNVLISAENFNDQELKLESKKFEDIVRQTTDGHPDTMPLPPHKNQKHAKGVYDAPSELVE